MPADSNPRRIGSREIGGARRVAVQADGVGLQWNHRPVDRDDVLVAHHPHGPLDDRRRVVNHAAGLRA